MRAFPDKFIDLMCSLRRSSHSTRTVEAVLLFLLSAVSLVYHREDVGFLPICVLFASAYLSVTRRSSGTKMKCSRLRKSSDVVGLPCGSALILSLLPALPRYARVFAMAVAVTSLVCAALSAINSRTMLVATVICVLVALGQVDVAQLQIFSIPLAGAVPTVQRVLVFRCPSCFTVAESTVVAGGICGVFSMAIREITVVREPRCDVDEDAALRGMTVSALLGAILVAVIGIGDSLMFAASTTRRRVFVILWGIVLPTYTFAFLFGARCEPVSWTVRHVLRSAHRIAAMTIWTSTAVVTVAGMSLTSAEGGAQVVQRKAYHVAVLVIFLCGVAADEKLMGFAAAVGLAVLLLMEMGRICGVERVERFVHAIGGKLVDEKDRGKVKVTHVYLLAGCAVPLWARILGSNATRAIPGLSGAGVVTVCVMDSVAAAVGRRFGRTSWAKGANRSLEGSAAGIVAGVAFARMWGMIDGWTGAEMWVRVTAACVGAGILEGTTAQIDNLVLPLAYWAVLGSWTAAS